MRPHDSRSVHRPIEISSINPILKPGWRPVDDKSRIQTIIRRRCWRHYSRCAELLTQEF